MRRAKADATQPEIMKALRDAGCLVESLHRVGGGVPDLLVCRNGRLYLVECKTAGGKLNPEQVKFQQDGWPVTVLRSAEDADEWAK